MKIYTKTGDSGTTGLFAGKRVPKDHPRISAYGVIDELNALFGVVAATLSDAAREYRLSEANLSLGQLILQVQSDLFSVGAELATPEPEKHDMCLLKSERIGFLEKCIDEVDARLQPLSNFVMPGGSLDSAMLHLARTVCRRGEREVVQLSHQDGVHDCRRIIVYLNRLSDLLFVLARLANSQADVPDIPWVRPEDEV